MSQPTIATADDAPEVGRVLAAGFGDDPVLRWVFEAPNLPVKLAGFFGFLAAEAFVPLGATYVVDGGCAAWTPPETPPWPADRDERFVATLGTVCSDGDLGRLAILDRAMTDSHPSERHWYLSVVAVEPARQGKGTGSLLLERSLRRVDADALPAYLESTNPRNVTLYERHGFEVIGRIDVADGVSLIPMWRPVTG